MVALPVVTKSLLMESLLDDTPTSSEISSRSSGKIDGSVARLLEGSKGEIEVGICSLMAVESPRLRLEGVELWTTSLLRVQPRESIASQ